MAAKHVRLSANGNSDPLTLDLRNFKPGVGIYVTITGSATAKVQVTGDGNNTWPPLYWNDVDTMPASGSSFNGQLTYPATAVRLVVTNYVSGTIHLAVVQVDTEAP